MPRRNPKGVVPGPQPAARTTKQPRSDKPETPSQLSEGEKATWLKYADRPDVQFGLEFHRDMEYALNREQALAMESELELELENHAREAGVETWVEGIMKQSIGACPPSHSTEYESRFQATPDAFKAMDLQTPFEAMLASQTVSLFSHVQRTLRDAGLVRDLNAKLMHYNLAMKLSATQVRATEALYRLKNKGQQKVTVEHVQIDDGSHKSSGRRVTVERTNTAEDSVELDEGLSQLTSSGGTTLANNPRQTVDIKIRPNRRRQK